MHWNLSLIFEYLYRYNYIVYELTDVSEGFPVNVGLRQSCVMSPLLFNVYMDCVVREVNVRVFGKDL